MDRIDRRFGELVALVTVAHQAKEWMAAHALKRWAVYLGKPPASQGLPQSIEMSV